MIGMTRDTLSSMWPFTSRTHTNEHPELFLTNTLSGKKERFVSLRPNAATLYSCGPTVYDRASIGNLRAYVFADTLARALSYAGYKVQRVINITDVGHLVADAEQGEDKMDSTAKREHKTPQEIAAHYTGLFFNDIQALNIDASDITFPRATEYIREQIAMVETLEGQGFAYPADDGIYFDTSKFPGYGKLGGIDTSTLQAGARITTTSSKRHPHDFALWRFAKAGDLQQWDSPWGKGNPGWHIECSAMSRALLGPEIDIHTGGIDHIGVHHNNEIAQSEALTQKPFVRYWMHNAFLTMTGEKISKSLGNVFYISDITARGIHPLALRYFFLQAHYRTPLAFSWDALAGAAEALTRLWRIAKETRREAAGKSAHSSAQTEFAALLMDDLATPQAIGLLWETLRDQSLSAAERLGILDAADKLLGLSLENPPLPETFSLSELPDAIRLIAEERETARKARDFREADRLRAEIETRGYRVDDRPEGTVFSPILTTR